MNLRKIFLTNLFCMVVSIVFGQLRVGANGTFGTTSAVPLIFDVNAVKSGSTGSPSVKSVSFGYEALFNTTETDNVAIGQSALQSCTTATANVALGLNALRNNTGESNTAGGTCALSNTTSGSGNTAFGAGALNDNTTGSLNTAVGFWTKSDANNLSNTTAIGSNAKVTESNQVRIGNTTVNSIGGYAAWSIVSDGRVKQNVRKNVPGLVFINSLQPVTYNLDLDAIDVLLKTEKTDTNSMPQELIDMQKAARESKEKQIQTGFVAQDVEKSAKSIGYDFSGVGVDETGIYSLRYAEFVVPLVKAVQELSEQNDL